VSITVYSKPACPACVGTKRYLAKAALNFVEVDISADPEAAALVAELGYTQAPVVVAGDQHWSGLRPDRIQALANPVETTVAS
jgi:glutaredoxin-like protein NrdH